MTTWVGVLGTHGWPDDPATAWWHYMSPFSKFLRSHGLIQARPDTPFVWSGDLQGVPLFGAGKDWEAGAAALRFYLDPLPYDARNLIAHSHGGAVALFAAREIPIRSLITVGTPVRKAVKDAAMDACDLGHIGRWIHVYDAQWDRTQWLGQLFDGRWFGRRAFRVPGMTDDGVKGIGHSSVLHDPTQFSLWNSRGWIEVLTVGPDVEAA